MEDESPTRAYYRWTPADAPDGMYQIVGIGEIRPGRIVEVTPAQAVVLDTSPDWKKSNAKAFTEQPPIHQEREDLRVIAERDD